MRVAALILTTLSLLGSASTVEKLNGKLEPFLGDFQHAEGRVRLVVLLSPT
jgi:hypothetical protein